MIMAYYRTNRPQLAAASYARMLNSFSVNWKMDAPLKDFGNTTWTNEDTMCTIDAFAHSSALIRGLFEYLYAAETLTLVPHIPDNITDISQKFPIRWGGYRLWISASGVRSSGIANVTVNGSKIDTFNATTATLTCTALPSLSTAAAASASSDISVASDTIRIHISFNEQAKCRLPSLFKKNNGTITSLYPSISPPLPCAALRNSCVKSSWLRGYCGLTSTESIIISTFEKELKVKRLSETLPASMARASQAYMDAFDERCAGLNNGTIRQMASPTATLQTLRDVLGAAGNIFLGLNNSLTTRYAVSSDPTSIAVVAAWHTAEKAVQ